MYKLCEPPGLKEIAPRSDIAMLHTCPSCDLTSYDLQAIKLHMFSKHGIKDEIHRHIDSVHCPICMVHYHTKERLLNHLSSKRGRTNTCRTTLLARPPCLTWDQVTEIDKGLADGYAKLHASAKRRHDTEGMPCIQVYGPFISGIIPASPSRAREYRFQHPLGNGFHYLQTLDKTPSVPIHECM